MSASLGLFNTNKHYIKNVLEPLFYAVQLLLGMSNNHNWKLLPQLSFKVGEIEACVRRGRPYSQRGVGRSVPLISGGICTNQRR